jgi:hypothetical protein
MILWLSRYGSLMLSPAAWAINTQLGQILPHSDCGGGSVWTAVAAFAAAAVALGGALLSQRRHAEMVSRSELFTTRIAVVLGLIFAFALLLQGAATVLLDPCAR